jgi:hypothetical protein
MVEIIILAILCIPFILMVIGSVKLFHAEIRTKKIGKYFLVSGILLFIVYCIVIVNVLSRWGC